MPPPVSQSRKFDPESAFWNRLVPEIDPPPTYVDVTPGGEGAVYTPDKPVDTRMVTDANFSHDLVRTVAWTRVAP